MQIGESREVVSLPFVASQGVPVGLIRIQRRVGGLFILDEVQARDSGEERVQIVEGYSYEYQLENIPDGGRLRASSILQPSRLAPGTGRIEPGLNTGLLPLVLENETGGEIARTALEVRSAKVDYRRDYRDMLESIAEHATGLLLDIRAPAYTRLAPGSLPSNDDVHRQFAFLRYLLQNKRFQEAIERILRVPHRAATIEEQTRDIRRGVKGSSAIASQFKSSSRRLPIPRDHGLYKLMAERKVRAPSLPPHVTVESRVDTIDTPENRFVKFALQDFEAVLTKLEMVLQERPSDADNRILQELSPLRSRLSRILERDFFKELSAPDMLPLGSPVLQRRAGYRELLQSWTKFNLAAHLIWAGADDVFGAGKRDVATLYEYWLFFELLRLAQVHFNVDPSADSRLIEWTTDRFDLKLKMGRNLHFGGTFDSGDTPLKVQFSFNRTFNRHSTEDEKSYPAPGSWSRPMRPDFTFTFWPLAFTLEEAERQELAVHVHFDAKYRVDALNELFGTNDSIELDREKEAQRTNTAPKRADLLKMHAYRDAVRRTAGAYVLYPGSLGADRQWHEFHEILPGLGAFAIRPGGEGTGIEALSRFLEAVARHVSDESTRRLQAAYHVFRIQEPSGKYRAIIDLPPKDEQGRALRKRPASERPERVNESTPRRRKSPRTNRADKVRRQGS